MRLKNEVKVKEKHKIVQREGEGEGEGEGDPSKAHEITTRILLSQLPLSPYDVVPPSIHQSVCFVFASPGTVYYTLSPCFAILAIC